MLQRTSNDARSVKPLNRIQENLVARNERRLLNYLCERLPAWVMPDHLTGLAVFAAFVIGLGYILSWYDPNWLWMSVGFYFVHWFGDSLDGSIARYRKIERPRFGYFIDHSMDALGTMMMLVGMGIGPYVRLDVALFALTGYFLLSMHTFLAARVLGEMKLSYIAAGPTELRMLLIAMTIAMWATGWREIAPTDVTPFDWLVGGVATILTLLFVGQTATTARRILREGEAPRA
ncbi:CDP-alcohol phosphatidyltransferase family protein [Sphingomonas jaspsi]|uniref:CDP-alcohol phosphatidyltransferase family protein n=1 Tax=Sphingomonas jaspsi TaxID=392409 RepID=UPI0004B7A56A|nr:CDP-alcohol phosphatidyltransferase family protein [Sphingomonas jaspsi]